MAITAVVNRKGGASKSTISLNLAAVMAEAGNRVLLIDADPQQTAQDWLAARDDAAPFQILGLPKPVLHRELPNLAGDYDQIIIDRRAHRARTRAARPGGSGDAGHPRGAAGADVMKRAAFKQPRQASTVADEWVKGDQAAGDTGASADPSQGRDDAADD